METMWACLALTCLYLQKNRAISRSAKLGLSLRTGPILQGYGRRCSSRAMDRYFRSTSWIPHAGHQREQGINSQKDWVWRQWYIFSYKAVFVGHSQGDRCTRNWPLHCTLIWLILWMTKIYRHNRRLKKKNTLKYHLLLILSTGDLDSHELTFIVIPGSS